MGGSGRSALAPPTNTSNKWACLYVNTVRRGNGRMVCGIALGSNSISAPMCQRAECKL